MHIAEQFDFLDNFKLMKKRARQKAQGKATPPTDRRTRDHERGKSKADILRIVERVAAIRNVDATQLFSQKREHESIASARSFAMAACAAVGVPLCHIARAFGRKWQVCYSAEIVQARRYKVSSAFRSEWESVTTGADPTTLHF